MNNSLTFKTYLTPKFRLITASTNQIILAIR